MRRLKRLRRASAHTMTDDPDDEGDDSSLDDSFTVPPSVAELREMSVKGLHAMLRSLGMPGELRHLNRETGKWECETKAAMIQRLLDYLPERRPAENSEEHLRSMSRKYLQAKLRSLGLLGLKIHMNRETGKREQETKAAMIQRLLDHYAGRRPAEHSEEHLRSMSKNDLNAKLLSLGLLGQKKQMNRETGKWECESKDGMIQRLLDHCAGRRPAENSEEHLRSMSRNDLMAKLLSLGLLGLNRQMNRETGKWEYETKDGMIQRLLDHYAGRRPAENSEEHLRSMSKKDLHYKLLSLGLLGLNSQMNRETGKCKYETKAAMIQRLLDYFAGRRPAENSEEHLMSMSRKDLQIKLLSLGLLGQLHGINRETGKWEHETKAALIQRLLDHYAGRQPAENSEEHLRSMSKKDLQAKLLSLGLLGQKNQMNRETGKLECETKDGMIQRLLDHFAGRRPAENSEEHLKNMSVKDLQAKLRSLGLVGLNRQMTKKDLIAELLSLGLACREHPLNAEAAYVDIKERIAMLQHLLRCFAGESPAAECDEEKRMLTKSVLLTRLVESMGFLSQKRLTHKVTSKEAEAAMVEGILADLEAEANAALEEGTASEDAADVTEMAVDDACVVLDGPPALKKQGVGCA